MRIWILRALAYLTIFYIRFQSLFTNFTTGYIGGWRGDAGIYVWLTYEHITKVLTWPSVGFDVGMFYPYGRVLAYSDNFLFPGFFSKVWYLITGNLPLSYNTTIILALILGALVMHGLVVYLFKDTLVGWIGGISFLFLPFFEFHRGHPQLQFAFVLPLTIYSSIRFCEERRSLHATLIGGSILCAFLCAVYYALYCYLIAGLILALYAYLKQNTISRRDLISLCVMNLPWCLALFLLMKPYEEVRTALDAIPLSIIKQHSPLLSAYIAAPYNSLFASWLTHRLSCMEGYLYFSFTLLLLTIAGSLEIWGAGAKYQNGLSRGAMLTTLCFLAYALCEIFQVSSHALAVWSLSIGFWMLLIRTAKRMKYVSQQASDTCLSDEQKGYLLLFCLIFFLFASLGFIGSSSVSKPFPELYKILYFLPGYNALRGIERLGLVVIIFSILVACRTLRCYLQHRSNWSYRGKLCFTFSVLFLVGFELRTKPEEVVVPAPAPNIYETLKTLPDRDPLLILPIGSLSRGNTREIMNKNTYYMQWSHEAGHPILNGFSGKIPPFFGLESEAFDTFPSQEALSLMGRFVGLRYVIYHPRFTYDAEWYEKTKSVPDEQLTKISGDVRRNSLFSIDPIVDVADTKIDRFYIKPDTKNIRGLEFSVRNRSDIVRRIEIEIPIGMNQIKHCELEVPPHVEWERYGLELPKSPSPVLPHEIRLMAEKGTNRDVIFVRRIKITAQESLQALPQAVCR